MKYNYSMPKMSMRVDMQRLHGKDKEMYEPVDMNAALVEEKPGTGLEKRDFGEVQHDLRKRFELCDNKDYQNEYGKGGEY